MKAYIVLQEVDCEGLSTPEDPIPVYETYDDAQLRADVVTNTSRHDVTGEVFELDLASDPRVAKLLKALDAAGDLLIPSAYVRNVLDIESAPRVQPEPKLDLDEPFSNTALLEPSCWLVWHTDIEIIDPDGWRGPNAPAWDQPLTYVEFFNRLTRCTLRRKEQA